MRERREPGAVFLIGATLALLATTGCTPGCYLSEAEVTAYRNVLRTAPSATELLDNLQDQLIEIEFDAGTTPRVRRSNLLAILRGLPELFFVEQVFHQIRLDRLSTELEAQLNAWLADRLTIFQAEGGGSTVSIRRLDRVTVRILAPPAVAYLPREQTIVLDSRVRLRISGVLEIRDPGGILGTLVGWLIPDGQHSVTVVVDGFGTRSRLHLGRGGSDAGDVHVRIEPQPGTVQVEGQVSNTVKDGIRRLVQQQLSASADHSRRLAYDYFALSRVRLSEAPANELEVGYRARPRAGDDAVLDLVALAEDFTLHHARRRGGIWSPFTAVPLGGTVGGRPALVASGPEQLELVGVAPNGDLFHGAWREGRWEPAAGSWRVEGILRSNWTPAVVATAPGQLEVVSIARGGGLFHKRRVNGQWSGDTGIDHNPSRAPIRHPVAVPAGNLVVLLFVDSQDLLWGKIFDIERAAWGGTFLLHTNTVFYTPGVASCGDGRIDVVYMRSDQMAYHRTLTVRPDGRDNLVLQSAETRLGAPGEIITTGPKLTCSGYQELELVARGADHQMRHNRFQQLPRAAHDGRQLAPGWQGWVAAGDRFPGTIFSARIEDQFDTAGAHTGGTHVAARSETATGRLLFHNSYDAARYGRAPWKAVHWRGFQRVSRGSFGSPSLALSDPQLELAVMGDDGRVRFVSMPEMGLVSSASVSDAAVQFPFEPVVLSSGPGIVDVLFLGIDGAPRHNRRTSGVTSADVTLQLPRSGRRIFPVASPLAAAGYGSGQIEVAAVASDRAVYHWRHVSGQWHVPVRIGGTIISAPALVHTGAGQLELFAVGSDQRLYRWRFAEGRWTSAQRVPTTFAVSAVMFGAYSASSWGDGTVDLVAVEDRTGRIFHRRFGPGMATGILRTIDTSDFVELGGRVADAPVLTAVGPTRLNVVAGGSDGRIYSTWAQPRRAAFRPRPPVPRPVGPRLEWLALEPIGAPGMLAGNVVRLGDRDLVVAAVDRIGRVYLNRFAGWRWLGFQPLVNQPPQLHHRPPVRPALAAH